MRICSLFPLGIALFVVPPILLATKLKLRAETDGNTFQPIIEADLPADFPKYTPVGEVQIKRYPAYRKAETETNTGEKSGTVSSCRTTPGDGLQQSLRAPRSKLFRG